jgi:hypothetical protein
MIGVCVVEPPMLPLLPRQYDVVVFRYLNLIVILEIKHITLCLQDPFIARPSVCKCGFIKSIAFRLIVSTPHRL